VYSAANVKAALHARFWAVSGKKWISRCSVHFIPHDWGNAESRWCGEMCMRTLLKLGC